MTFMVKFACIFWVIFPTFGQKPQNPIDWLLYSSPRAPCLRIAGVYGIKQFWSYGRDTSYWRYFCLKGWKILCVKSISLKSPGRVSHSVICVGDISVLNEIHWQYTVKQKKKNLSIDSEKKKLPTVAHLKKKIFWNFQ